MKAEIRFTTQTLLLLTLYFVSCGNNSNNTVIVPLRHLGDISFDENIDDPNFVICNGEDHVYQYFNLGDNIEIEGGKPKIISHFKQHYDNSLAYKESGLARIRFIVNCHGEIDRFRVLMSDLEYKEKTFDKSVIDQIVNLSKSLSGWQVKYNDKGIPCDYYQYLIFRIVDGEIIKILP